MDALGNTTTYVYDAAYRVTKVITPTGATTTYEYDSLGRNTKITTDEGSIIYEYDAYGNILSMTDVAGNVTKYEYDNLGRKTAVILPDGSKQETTYDSRGNVTSQTDAEGATTTYEYDNNNNLTSITNGEGETTTYVYNGAGELLSQTDANGKTTTYQYNGAGNVTKETRADGKYKTFAYNTDGDVTSVTDYDGTKLANSYKNHLLSQSKVGTQTVKYTYDDLGRLTSAYDSTGTIRYGYDSYGRIASRETATGEKIEYGYDAFGRMNAITTSQGTTRYGFDKYNRLTEEKSTVAREDGTTDRSAVAYFYDSAGNRTKKVEDNVTTEYTYNELNQLLSETTEGQETISYAYDLSGNLLCRGTTTEYETYTYTKANMLESVTSTTKTDETKEVYTYDAEGNRLSKTESKAVKSVDETTGEVTTTWEETDKTYYVMDTSGSYSQVIAELDADKQMKVLYTRGDGIISREEVEKDGTTSRNFYLSDGHGDVRQLTDETGAVTDSYRYNSYGELEETQGETENPYLYTGEYFDEGTGLYYLRARYMNPETGTFTSMDTYRGNAYDPASLHRYTYAQNNPQMYNDPSGHFIGLIGAATNLACAQMIRTTCVTNMAGTLTGFVNGIISKMLGGEEDAGAAFVKGFLFGAGAIVGIAAAYAGATAIKTLFTISDALDALSLAREVVECVKSIVLAIVYGVTGCRTQAAIYLSFAAIYFTDILVTLGLSGIVRAIGPKGKVDIGVESGSNTVNPNDIRFSQSSVNGSAEIVESMRNNGWAGDPIDVVRMPDGGLTTIDNTRVVAARQAGIDVQANIHAYDDLLPSEYIDRFTTKKGVPTTWGDAITLRIGKQNATFRNNNPFGSVNMDNIK